MLSARRRDNGANETKNGFGSSLRSDAFAIGEKKVMEYIAMINKIVLRIKRLSFGCGIGLGSLVPVYVKYSYASSIANSVNKLQTLDEPLTG